MLAALALFATALACDSQKRSTANEAVAAPLSGRLLTPEQRDEGSWPLATKDHSNTRFSSLAQITTDNVKRLRLAWELDLGIDGGQEAAPVVADDTMFVVTSYPNIVYAIDLTRPGRVKWKYEPRPSTAAQGVACCDVVNRGVAYAAGRVFVNTLDNHTIALNAETGAEIWRTKLGEISRGETMTMAPTVVKNRVLVGNSGGEMGVRGWLTALDAESGAIVWRAFSTGPDRDVLIGPEFRPFYAKDRGRDLGVRSWPPEKWQTGGGTVWGFVSYDPELDLVYYGTANPGPWNPEQRPGDNLWTAGVFARRPETGQAVWFYQWSAHDQYDHDGVNELVLVDLEIDGQRRKLLLHPDRNGYVYVLDRRSGEVLSATPFTHITTSRGVDLKSGRLLHVDAKKPGTGRTVREICPSASGGKDWQPSAFSPATGLLYIPHQNLCQDEQGLEANYIQGTPFVGANVRMYAGPGGHRGELTAWDPIARKAVWKLQEKFPIWSGTVVTAGNLVFYGTMDGAFVAVHARTGERLWRHQTESGIIGQPVSYLGPDGKQYVAVLSGVGGWAGVVVSQALDARDKTAALGFVGAMADLPSATQRGGHLYVFGLP